MAAVRAGDVVVAAERLADADRDRLLADVEVGEARHLRGAVELVHVLLEGADPPHLLVHPQRELGADLGGAAPASVAISAPPRSDPDSSASTS